MVKMNTIRKMYRASALIITLMFIVLLGLEALVVGLLLSRSSGTEAVLRGKSQSVRRATELVINTLSNAMYYDMVYGNYSLTQMLDRYKRDGSVSTYSTLATNRYDIVNPESGANDQLGIETSAWVQERRGNYFHLVGRAKNDDVDLITHKWVLLKPCTYSQSGAAVLTTILSSVNYPGYNSTGVDPVTGRVFFGVASNSTTTTTNLYSWLPATGLSTLLSGKGIGNRSLFVASDGRAFIGEGDDSGAATSTFWTWKDSILSTIKTGLRGAGRGCDSCGQTNGFWYTRTQFDTRNDRIYFGEDTGGIYTWKNGTLATIYNDNDYAIDRLALAGTDEAYLVDDTAGNGVYKLYRWTPASGATLASDLAGTVNTPGRTGLSAQANGRVWFSENPGKLHSWHSSTGLSTINGTYDSAVGPNWFQELNTGEVLIGADGGSYVWKPSSEQTVTTIKTGSMISYSTTNGSEFIIVQGYDYAWTPSKGLSTIMTWTSGDQGSTVFDTNGYAYLGETHATGDLTVWNLSSNVTTLVALGVPNPGAKYSTTIDSTGRVYFGQDSATGRVRSYKLGSGLTTVISASRSYPGVYSMKAHPVEGVYFGEASATGNFYYYGPASSNSCLTRPF